MKLLIITLSLVTLYFLSCDQKPTRIAKDDKFEYSPKIEASVRKSAAEPVQAIESTLSKYSGRSYDEFSAAELSEYNALVFNKARLIKKQILEKFYQKYKGQRI